MNKLNRRLTLFFCNFSQFWNPRRYLEVVSTYLLLCYTLTWLVMLLWTLISHKRWVRSKKKIKNRERLHPIIKNITTSSIVIGLKNSYFPLIRLPSCYRTVCYCTVCYWTVCYFQFVIGQFNQPITFKVVAGLNLIATLNNLRLLCRSFNALKFALSLLTWLFFFSRKL